MSRLRNLSSWLFSPKLLDLASYLHVRYLAAGLAENRSLENRHAADERCFVIGNGPSLKDMDLKPLANEYTVGCNSFYKHPDADAVQLKYLCIGDPHFMIDQPRAVEWHRLIESRMPKTVILLHPQAKALIEKHGLYRSHELHFFSQGGRAADEARWASVDFSRPLNVGMSAGTLVAIPLALFLGFRKIYLLGFDATWLDAPERSYHFYDKHEYFPEFDSIAADNRKLSYEFEVRSVVREMQSHRLLNELATRRGAIIFNATRVSRIDVYPRVRFEDCFGGPGGSH